MVDNPRSTEQGEPAQKPDSSRWCWECRRRRLVCDCARPVCNTCRATGVVCPGYGDVKPLKWLLPGTVLSRVRKPRKRHAGQRAAAKEGKEDVESNPDSRASSSQELVCCRSTTSPSPGAWLRTDLCDLAEAAMYCKTASFSCHLETQFSSTRCSAGSQEANWAPRQLGDLPGPRGEPARAQPVCRAGAGIGDHPAVHAAQPDHDGVQSPHLPFCRACLVEAGYVRGAHAEGVVDAGAPPPRPGHPVHERGHRQTAVACK